MCNYDLSEQAKEDLLRIYQYGIGQFGLSQADKYFEMLFDCFDKIAENPFMFPTSKHLKEDYRYCVCGVDNIFYKVISDNLIEIVTIIGRQDF